MRHTFHHRMNVPQNVATEFGDQPQCPASAIGSSNAWPQTPCICILERGVTQAYVCFAPHTAVSLGQL